MKHIDVSHELIASFFRILFGGSISLQNGGKFTPNRIFASMDIRSSKIEIII
jgi:hypothetical protein